MIVMLSLLVLVGMVMNHIYLFGDPLWVTDTQPISFGIVAMYFPSPLSPSVLLISQSIRERRASSSHKKIGEDFRRGQFLIIFVISL